MITPRSVLIADDHELLRAGLRRIINADAGLRVVAEAGDGEEAVSLALAHRPDLVVMDVNMPRLDGIRATARISGFVGVIALSTYDDRATIRAMARAGALAYVIKGDCSRDLLSALRAVAQGDTFFSPRIDPRLRDELVRAPPTRACVGQ